MDRPDSWYITEDIQDSDLNNNSKIGIVALMEARRARQGTDDGPGQTARLANCFESPQDSTQSDRCRAKLLQIKKSVQARV